MDKVTTTTLCTVLFIGLVIVLVGWVCMLGVGLYLEGFTLNTQTFTKTARIDKLIEGKTLHSIYGFIDSNGVGYIKLDTTPPLYVGETYNITYFYDKNNLRKAMFMDHTPPPTPTPTPVPLDVFKCVNVSGVCR
jgi:hypothetical protein